MYNLFEMVLGIMTEGNKTIEEKANSLLTISGMCKCPSEIQNNSHVLKFMEP